MFVLIRIKERNGAREVDRFEPARLFKKREIAFGEGLKATQERGWFDFEVLDMDVEDWIFSKH